ncbi:hypothetical protein ABZV22_20495, partial [Streptosporangium canum]
PAERSLKDGSLPGPAERSLKDGSLPGPAERSLKDGSLPGPAERSLTGPDARCEGSPEPVPAARMAARADLSR